MNSYQLPINSNGTIDISSLSDIKHNLIIDIIDVLIIRPKFHLNEKVIFNNDISEFKGEYTRSEIARFINHNKSEFGPGSIGIDGGQITVYLPPESSGLHFDPKGRIANILGFDQYEYSGRGVYVYSNVKLDQRVFYYDIKYNSKSIAIMTENKVVQHEAFRIITSNDISTCIPLGIFDHFGNPLSCFGGHIQCLINVINPNPDLMLKGDTIMKD